MIKKRIEMFTTVKGAEFGIEVKTFEAGKIYYIAEKLADIFIRENIGRVVAADYNG
jgi:hypothetical protein